MADTSLSRSGGDALPPAEKRKPGDTHVSDDTLGGAVDRLTDVLKSDPGLAKNALANRQELERYDRILRLLGLVAGFVLAWHIVGDASELVKEGHDWAGVVLGTLDVVGLVGIFVTGRYIEHRIHLRSSK